MYKTIDDLLRANRKIYSIPDDRLLDIEEFFYYQEKYILRYLEARSKNKKEELSLNLIITLSWFFALVNRFHVNLEEDLKKRYSYKLNVHFAWKCLVFAKKTKK